jgi:hypothetical protein
MTKSAITHNPTVDWAKIRTEYESSVLSVRALAKKHGTTDQGIAYHAKKKNWLRPAEYVKHANSLKPESVKLKASSGDLATVGAHLAEVPVENDMEALAALRQRIISQHKVSVSRDLGYLDLLEKSIMEKKSAPLQKLRALQDIVKIRGQLIELERQAHSIAGDNDRSPAANNVQVNVHITPQDAYRAMLEGGK